MPIAGQHEKRNASAVPNLTCVIIWILAPQFNGAFRRCNALLVTVLTVIEVVTCGLHEKISDAHRMRKPSAGRGTEQKSSLCRTCWLDPALVAQHSKGGHDSDSPEPLVSMTHSSHLLYPSGSSSQPSPVRCTQTRTGWLEGQA